MIENVVAKRCSSSPTAALVLRACPQGGRPNWALPFSPAGALHHAAPHSIHQGTPYHTKPTLFLASKQVLALVVPEAIPAFQAPVEAALRYVSVPSGCLRGTPGCCAGPTLQLGMWGTATHLAAPSLRQYARSALAAPGTGMLPTKPACTPRRFCPCARPSPSVRMLSPSFPPTCSRSQDEDRPATAAAAEVLAGLLAVPAVYASGGETSAQPCPALPCLASHPASNAPPALAHA